jgi:hypothetical protein
LVNKFHAPEIRTLFIKLELILREWRKLLVNRTLPARSWLPADVNGELSRQD